MTEKSPSVLSLRIDKVILHLYKDLCAKLGITVNSRIRQFIRNDIHNLEKIKIRITTNVITYEEIVNKQKKNTIPYHFNVDAIEKREYKIQCQKHNITPQSRVISFIQEDTKKLHKYRQFLTPKLVD